VGVKWKWNREWRSSHSRTAQGLVGGEVVEDDMYVEVVGDLAVDLVQERDEVRSGVGLAQVGDDLAGGDLQGGNQVQGAVADVVVGGLLRGGRQHRQGRCGPVERLDLRLLVDGVDRGRDRWGQAQADQVADLLDLVRIGRDLELVLSLGLEPEGTPDLNDGLSADPVPLGHRPGRPVCGVLGCGLQRLDHDGLDDLVADRARRARPRCVDQPLQPLRGEPVAHLPTVTLSQPSSSAILVFGLPSAQASTVMSQEAGRV
jgi:hypothetical protein